MPNGIRNFLLAKAIGSTSLGGGFVSFVLELCSTREIVACKSEAMKSFLNNDLSGFCR